MNTILAAILSIALGAPGALGVVAEVDGIPVARTSLTGYRVARQDGLTAKEAAAAVEALIVDDGWVALVRSPARCVPKRITLPVLAPVKPVPAKREPTFYAVVVDAVKAHRNLGTLTLRNAPLRDGSERVVIDVLATKGLMVGQHAEVALILARALIQDGLPARASGSDVHVFASVA